MNSRVLLDTSAVIAYLLNEPGEDKVAEALDRAAIAAPNAAEIVAVLMRRGCGEDEAVFMLQQLRVPVVPLDESAALRTGVLIAKTRHLGLSLGDCACLALALERNADVLSADRQWAKLDFPVCVTLIR